MEKKRDEIRGNVIFPEIIFGCKRMCAVSGASISGITQDSRLKMSVHSIQNKNNNEKP